METSPNSSAAGKTRCKYAGSALTRLFFVFLSTPSETATINTMPAGLTPDLGLRRSGGSGDLRQGNLTQILRYVRDHGASSRHDIARGCGLGISTMTDLIGELGRAGSSKSSIRFAGPEPADRLVRLTSTVSRGASSAYASTSTDSSSPPSTLGGRELWRDSVTADLRRADPGRRLRRAGQPAALPARSAASLTSILIAVEIGVPGYVAEDRATVGWSESPEWQDFPLSAKVSTTLSDLGIEGAHVGVTNDSQLAALHAVRIELALAAGCDSGLPRRSARRRQRPDHRRRDLPWRRRRCWRLRPSQRRSVRAGLLTVAGTAACSR